LRSEIKINHVDQFVKVIMLPIATLMIPGRVRIKKNGKRIFKRGKYLSVLSSVNFVDWEGPAILALKEQWRKMPEVLDFPLEVHYSFYFENHQAEPDTSNCIEGPQDCMQKAGIISNDKIIKVIRAEKFFGHAAKTIIEIYRYQEAQIVAVG
jgi:Holliday junction resolvase RusA-like endonuclease